MVEIDATIDYFVDHNDLELAVLLAKTIADPDQGGLGYHIEFFNPLIDFEGYEVDTRRKVIRLDIRGTFGGENGPADIAANLKTALEVEIARTHRGLWSRVAWGTGKVILGVVEVGTGLVGILVPVPGTTVAGVLVFALGANTVFDGFTQLAGANRGEGYNVLGEASGAIGAGIADTVGANREAGREVGQDVFLIASIAVGAIGSIHILRVPGQVFVRAGVAGRPGGAVIGRIDLLYPSSRAADGMTILNINNNAGQSILRFVTHGGRLVVNGRIVGVSRVLSHEGNAREILKGLLKLLAYGARQGW